jgi:hypothetical protein
MKVSKLEIGKLYKIKDKLRLQAFKTDECRQIVWGSTLDKKDLIDHKEIFQYLGKKKRHRVLRKESRAQHYIQHIFMLLSDSREYIISGYHTRNLEQLN